MNTRTEASAVVTVQRLAPMDERMRMAAVPDILAQSPNQLRPDGTVMIDGVRYRWTTDGWGRA
jgi:hypothetical protein